jgi:subfamily B ATP-binding cassette protein MsbA
MIILPVSGYLISRLGKTLKSTAKKSQERLGEVLNVVEESLTGVKVIKSFGAENQLKGIFQ